ncbi:linoleate 13S-lipoxygenase 2-1, chloroplastic-like [Benincasa hispida]|uniref:linoleate 13S-lipoxygenase 2-1, chloroplastic-like n=1 Tax=Benincasa hispida TaxID=102211 RepID=UPI001902BA1C|nr:linoleate 13S-lipoxygenase 2-1, chloroplastic-like [Benincasa hispida]
MLNSPIHYRSNQALFAYKKPVVGSNVEVLESLRQGLKPNITSHLRFNNLNAIKPFTMASIHKPISVKVVVTIKRPIDGFFPNFGFKRRLALEFHSVEMDPTTGLEKGTIKACAEKVKREDDEVIIYETKLVIPADFGAIGAVLVVNEHNKEMLLKNIVIYGIPSTAPLHFPCNSWLQSKDRRIFFTTKTYLPSNTPDGLKRYRREELRNLQGNGYRKREKHHRTYDYDVYNDLGDPGKGHHIKRPILGGKQYPYPRRCMTARPRTPTDPLLEVKSMEFYVPRDEAFFIPKHGNLLTKKLYSMLHGFLPALENIFTDQNSPLLSTTNHLSLLPRLGEIVADKAMHFLLLHPSQASYGDKFFWFRDEEFARQTLAGLNPYSIRLVTEWPLKSTLEPSIYGSPESAISDEIVEQQIKGFMSLDEAVKGKKLFILDYHDVFLPYVAKVRKLKGKTLYGSRTLFFLNPDSTLRPLAIELSRPPIDDKPQWKQVFTPCWDAYGLWLWRIAKAHVLAHDSGYHQLVSHWLRTHCCVEPYIIATHRQLSAMHPIYRLLHPHFRNTMAINAAARESLINAEGLIENIFSTGKYSMEISSMAYDKQWQFNLEALPADLIHRGLAVEDPNAAHGLKLSIEDYPFANDGLILWDAIKDWATEYVNHYYPNASVVNSDDELQAWWTEIRTVGHADKKDEPWWPILDTPKDLIDIVTTIMWVTSGHHAAVNFGQYPFAASYYPCRPSLTRLNIPTEQPNSKLWKCFLENPENVFLETFPTHFQATIFLSILKILSSHSPDEEYLGEDLKEAWADDGVIKEAFHKFRAKLQKLEEIIDERNVDPKLKNRHGAGIGPYELLKPYSEPGVTARGVPCSVSI